MAVSARSLRPTLVAFFALLDRLSEIPMDKHSASPTSPPSSVSAGGVRLFIGSPTDQIIKARVSGNRVFVKSLTHEVTSEEGEDSGWEDSDEAIESDEEREDGNKSDMFQRVTSKPNLVSRRSLLITLIHENDRASALQNAASRCASAIHRSSTSNGSIVSSLRKNVQGFLEPSIMITSNTYPPVPSLDSTRINMFSKELIGSLRDGLLWERRVKSSTFNVVKHRHIAHDIRNLQNYSSENRNSCSIHFDAGSQNYHQRGW